VTRHFELLGQVEARYPAFVRRKAELSRLILDAARLVDQTLTRDALPEGQQGRSDTLLAQADLLLRRCDGDAFERRTWAAMLRSEAAHLEHDGAGVVGATLGAAPSR